MCGVFGYISKDGQGPNLTTLERIATATERRGPHSFGFAWIDSNGRLKAYKQAGRISHHLGLLAMARDAQMLVGHCRYATHGDPADNVNNHPHPVDGGWLVHNGVIQNDDDLVERHDLMPVSECDSELLGQMIERFDGTLIERARSAVIEADGDLVMLALWNRPRRLIVACRGNPLRAGATTDGIYLASLADHLPRPKRVPDDRIVSYTFDAGRVRAVDRPLRAESPKGRQSYQAVTGSTRQLRQGTPPRDVLFFSAGSSRRYGF